MILLARCVVFVFFLASFSASLEAQGTSPCTADEKPPMPRETNPTFRNATSVEPGSGGTPAAATEACLVVGTKELVRPGPEPEYTVPSYGLYVGFNYAPINSDGRFVDVQGTREITGALDLSQIGNGVFATPLTLEWGPTALQPVPKATRLLTQLTVFPCTDGSSTCSPNSAGEVNLTRLLVLHGKEENNDAEHRVSAEDPGCLEPMRPGEADPHLRQLTVEGSGNQYSVFACLVSDRYESFQLANFGVNLLDERGNPTTAGVEGNTRQHIGPLHHGEDVRTPRVVTLLAVTIPSLGATAVPVASADVTIQYAGCTNEHETTCDAKVEKQYTQKVEYVARP